MHNLNNVKTTVRKIDFKISEILVRMTRKIER